MPAVIKWHSGVIRGGPSYHGGKTDLYRYAATIILFTHPDTGESWLEVMGVDVPLTVDDAREIRAALKDTDADALLIQHLRAGKMVRTVMRRGAK